MPGRRPARPEPPALFLQGMKGERERKGFLVTHVVRRDAEGMPLMKFSDAAKAEAYMAERRRQACGFVIGSTDWVCFVDKREDREFAEAPPHLICANYSLGTCPHLLARTRADSIRLVLCYEYEFLGLRPEAASNYLEPYCRALPLSTDDAQDVVGRLPYSDISGGLLRITPYQLGEWISPTIPSGELPDATD